MARKASSATFTAFLEYLLVAYLVAPKVAVICDNTIIHPPSSCSGGWPPPPGVVLLYGARYSPTTPGRARLGGAEGVAANSPTLAIEGRIRWVHTFFRARSPDQLLVMTAPHSCLWLPEDYVQKFTKGA